jgi:hypothetical protein
MNSDVTNTVFEFSVIQGSPGAPDGALAVVIPYPVEMAAWRSEDIPLRVEKGYSLSCRNIPLPVEIHGLVSVP